MAAQAVTPHEGARQHVPTDQAAPELCAGAISTDRHPVVRYRAGWDCGDTFGANSDYDGLALTIEIADAADARAMLEAISRRADLAAPSAPAEAQITHHGGPITMADLEEGDGGCVYRNAAPAEVDAAILARLDLRKEATP